MAKYTKIILITIGILIPLLILIFKLRDPGNSGQNKHSTTNVDKEDTVNVSPIASPDLIETFNEFPTTGKSAFNFVPAGYEIILEAKGLLDDDDLEDIAIILQEKQDSTALRPTLILLGQEDGSYRRYATSWNTIGPAFVNGDFQHYDRETLSIDSARNLNIHTYGSGPVGNRDLNYHFINQQLVLATMETFNAGAGEQTTVFYDFTQGLLKVTEVNTMKENMPPKIKQEKFKKDKPYLFETTDPTDVQVSF